VNEYHVLTLAAHRRLRVSTAFMQSKVESRGPRKR